MSEVYGLLSESYGYFFFPAFRRCGIRPPSLIRFNMKAGIGFAKNALFWVRSTISPVFRLTRTRSPSRMVFAASADSRRGTP